MVKPNTPSETLGSVPINSGASSNGKMFGGQIVDGKFIPHGVGDLRREVDPSGQIVEHRVRPSPYVHERLHNLKGPQKLADELYDAAEKFRLDFERAQLGGNYARLDLFKTRGGEQEMTDRVAVAKARVARAQKSLRSGNGEPSLSQSCIWHVVGLGRTLEFWTQLIRNAGKAMNADRASGVLHVSLERLALHYGLVDMGKLANINNNRAFARGLKAADEFISTCPPREDETGVAYASRLHGLFARRFEKFA